jgi:hypothetical protein
VLGLLHGGKHLLQTDFGGAQNSPTNALHRCASFAAILMKNA